ncbi:Uncharacterised protein [Ectopseudomonas mendocina]|uniref:DUF3149 domain-containing protein n=1 Tax=Ectopseudomonas mendocina TaxID=300 RepID=A0A379IQZ5_ECTME|nr:Uncharacterised protein [Pseudomonas mendocina]
MDTIVPVILALSLVEPIVLVAIVAIVALVVVAYCVSRLSSPTKRKDDQK